MKRQRGRGRKPGGGGGGGGNNHNHGNRSLESNGPEVKIRGTAAQIYEKYAQYARDAQSGGDRVRYENFLQHAEHYYRVMAATMPRDRLLAQQNGEGGMQQSQQPGEGNVQAIEGGISSGDTQDALKVMDDQSNDGDDGDDDIDSDRSDDGDRAEVQTRQDSAPQGGEAGGQDGEEGNGRPRRRRGRRGRNEGERSGNGGNGGGDPEARSALDSLARKQGALTGG
ncbi:MAG TPA: DUF4167 domain-containing protein [Hyphomonadaceae bacterium]|jgi:hypothetical protein|nr:DUF4167 domain-containing protein [Hyphomonadaceae bacterium]HPN04824.1 DUF4167 domain-containing protein [Hyphomonadaceae bacterium]